MSDGGYIAACVQMCAGLDRRANVATASTLIKRAAEKGAHLVVTPEMTSVIDKNPERLRQSFATTPFGFEVDEFAAVASDAGVWLVIGSMATPVNGGRLANRCHVFGPDGSLAAVYDKIHMFDVALDAGESWRESKVYAPGDKAVVVDTPLAQIGLSICYDIRFPHLYRRMAQAGAELFTMPAAFTRPTGKAHWRTLIGARAIECGAFVVAAAQAGVHEDGRETWGHSMIVSPWGEVLAELRTETEGVAWAAIDSEKSAAARRQIPSLALENSPEVLKIAS